VGAFQVEVAVAPPQGIVLERVTPSEVIGELETAVSASVPVRVTVAGALGPDERLAASADPETAQVRGRAAVVANVVAVVVPVAAEDARTQVEAFVAPYAVDAFGRPVLDVAISPARVAVTLAVEAVRVERRVPVVVVAPTAAGWSDLSDAPDDVLVTLEPARDHLPHPPLSATPCCAAAARAGRALRRRAAPLRRRLVDDDAGGGGRGPGGAAGGGAAARVRAAGTYAGHARPRRGARPRPERARPG
jgi:hypothetical protein